MIMKKFDKVKQLSMTAAELYILSCKKWSEIHPRKRIRRSFYQAIGCKIYIGL